MEWYSSRNAILVYMVLGAFIAIVLFSASLFQYWTMQAAADVTDNGYVEWHASSSDVDAKSSAIRGQNIKIISGIIPVFSGPDKERNQGFLQFQTGSGR